MGVYIKGMKIPKSCFECVYYDEGNFCNAQKEYMHFASFGRDYKDANCPLVEVPELHGKLVEFIDVTTYEDDDSGTEEVNLGEAFAAYFKMREAKPVIESDGEE